MPINIAIHGGAGKDSPQIREHAAEYEKSLKQALLKGYSILKKGGAAIDAVLAATIMLEDDPLFNAGRGSALNENGQVEMDAAIMDGKTLNSGAVAIVQQVKNPVILAHAVMRNTKHVFIGGAGATELAHKLGLEIKPHTYFITRDQYVEFMKKRKSDTLQNRIERKMHGTVGAVALDRSGNLAAATSSGGAPNCLAGRISDSCMVGIGCYANNKTCAISASGDGEDIVHAMLAHSISSVVEHTKVKLQDACDFIIHTKNKQVEGDMGVISLDTKGNFGFTFNSERMFRAWMNANEEPATRIYK